MWDVGRCPFSLAKAVISITKRHYVTCVRCFCRAGIQLTLK